ncbi:MAG TPA: hypothetical protein VNX18_15550 [Bryobacteraceae bacterium]|jgi:hypothetical protein|nr:hypothetical protein [Bryobacteraceae bacterium]
MPSDLRAICEELRRVGSRPETPALRQKLEDGLSSKWDGVQVAAATALSQWGDARSVRSLKELLAAVAAKPDRSSTTHALAKLLFPHLQPTDLNWTIDVFINQSCAGNRGWLALLFEAFSPAELRQRLAAQKLHGGKAERDVRTAITRAQDRARVKSKSKIG